MAFQVSPGVLVVERDLTNIVPAVSTSIGGYAGQFQWGPVLDPVTVTSEADLVTRFGRPDNTVASSFFSAANFLSYSNNLKLVRVVGTAARNAVAIQSGAVATIVVTGGGTGYNSATVVIGAPDDPSGLQATATASLVGDSVDEITITNPGSGYTSAPAVSITGDGTGATLTSTITTGGVLINNDEHWEASFSTGAGAFGPVAAKYPGTLGNGIIVSMADTATFTGWDYEEFFDDAPGTSEFATALGGEDDELHIVVVDGTGAVSGIVGTILERFVGVSKAAGAKKSDGANNYYKDVLRTSKYVWWLDHVTGDDLVGGESAWGSAGTETFDVLDGAYTVTLSGGVDANSPASGDIQAGYDLFLNTELIDVNLLINGPHAAVVAKYLVEEIAEVRRDCVAFVSPELADVYNNASALDDVIDFRVDSSFNVNSSYGFMDSGWKYQYDKYNDVYRWVPLNADVAGLCARTDNVAESWFSPGGYNRGIIKNVVRLAWSPTKAQRDELYKKGINPVISSPGEGTILLGDKTLLAKPSAFDRINVRRLFIVLEKAVAQAAKFQLFEFNDAFTRAQFRNLVEPFLRDIQGRRGVTDFRVICNDTNNTGEVIDRNEFVADIYIKPARSINYITLTFVATRTGVAFEEIVGS